MWIRSWISIVSLSLLVTLTGATQENPMQPSSSVEQRDVLQEPDCAPQSVELKGSWLQKTDGTLILEREADSHGVRSVEAGLEKHAGVWQAGVSIEGELTGEERQRLRLYAQRAFFGERAKAFAEWNDQSDGTASVMAGVEYSMFGEDKWLLSRKLDPEASSTEVEDTLQLTLPITILGVDKLRLTGVKGSTLTELRGEVCTSIRENLEVGASVGTQRTPTPGADGQVWTVPQVQGSLKFNW